MQPTSEELRTRVEELSSLSSGTDDRRAELTRALAWFERSFLPVIQTADEANDSLLLSALDEHGLGRALLRVISGDGGVAEILREKAATLLRNLLRHKSSLQLPPPRSSSSAEWRGAEEEEEQTLRRSAAADRYLREFFVEFSDVFHRRLYSPPSLTRYTAPPPPLAAVDLEPVEEIRLLLVQILREILSALLSRCSETSDPLGGGSGTHLLWTLQSSNNGWFLGEGGIAAAEQRNSLIQATSNVCRTLPSRAALLDPYPDLKRECCEAVIGLCALAPDVIRMNAEALLRPLTIGCDAGTGDGTGRGRGSSTSSLLSSSSLLRHRHAKTRCLALDACAAVVWALHQDKAISACDASRSTLTLPSAERYDVNPELENNTKEEPAFEPGFEGSKDGTGDILEAMVLPSWEECCHDRSSSVRRELASCAFFVAETLLKSSREDFAVDSCRLIPERLVVLLLMCLSDDAEVNSTAAKENIAQVALLWSKVTGEEVDTVADGESLAIMLSTFFPLVLPILLNNAEHWAVERRVRALKTLRASIELILPLSLGGALCTPDATTATPGVSEEDVSELIVALFTPIGDEDMHVRSAAAECAEMLGRSRPSSRRRAFCVLFDKLDRSGRASLGDTSDFAPPVSPRGIVAALSLLGSLIRGSGCHHDPPPTSADSCDWCLCDLANDACAAMASRDVLDLFNDRSVMWSLFGACRALVDSLIAASVVLEGDAGSPFMTNFLRCCIQLLGCPESFALQEPAADLLDVCPTSLGQHLPDLIACLDAETLTSNDEEAAEERTRPWTRDDPQLHAFDALIRHSGMKSVAEEFEVVAPVLQRHLDTSSQQSIAEIVVEDHTVKLSMMALLQSVASDSSCPKHLLQPFSSNLLETVIIPNLVWQVGGPASALRKVAVASLFSLLQGGGISARSLFLTAPRLLPVLKSNINDDDTSTRQLVCSSLAMIFELIPGALGDEPVHQLYPDLLKSLDDCSDDVRFAACAAIKEFLTAAPPHHFKGTAIQCIVEQLLVHMDDPNHNIQNCCLDVLTVALNVDPSTVAKKAEEALHTHRDRTRCQSLLDRAHEKLLMKRVLESQ